MPKQKYPKIETIKKELDESLLKEIEDMIANRDKEMIISLIRLTKPFELKGDEEVALVISCLREKEFTRNGIRMRIKRGIYTKGEHFVENNGKMRMWNREAIISKELEIIQGRGSEVI